MKLITLAVVALAAASLRAEDFPSRWVDAPHKSGLHSNAGFETTLGWTTFIDVPETTWLRVEFSECDLGAKSYLVITSESNQRSHRLTTVTMQQWQKFSGALKGGRVRVDLYVAPGESGVFANIPRVLAGLPMPPIRFPDTLCDGDSRVNTRDDRVGRMFGGGCSAWLVSNGAVCSAGHCVSGGPGSFFEVNVPASDPNGNVNPSDPDDQFPINISNVPWQDSGGLGGDWGIYALFPNNNTGERAHWRGFIRPTQVVPAVNTTVRITGYGNDNTPAGTTGGFNNDHRTEQTSTGPFGGEFDNGGGNIYHAYRTDTEPANSGSPIIWRIGSVDFSTGIHTDGGCTNAGAGSNFGTAFNQAMLANTLNAFPPGGGERYLDTASSTGTRNGSLYEPFRDFTAAYNSAPNGGQVLMVTGGYPQATAGNTGTFGSGQTKSVTLRAPVGRVTIGN